MATQPVYNENRQGDLIMYGLVEDLKKYMKDRGVSYNELSRKTNGEVSNATVSRLLSHKTYPAFGTLYELYKALNIEIAFSVIVHETPEEEEAEEAEEAE